jgi:uncharacterized protein YbjT (DUF2867 family)
MILVTGATGSNGLELVKQLAARRVPVRAMVRNPAKATELQLPGVEIVAGDFEKPASLPAALKGIDRAFLLAPPVQDSDRLERAFIDAAKAAGGRHIVNLSAVGARPDAPHSFGRWHGKAEQYLKQSGLKYTILRPNFFMQNLLGSAAMIKGGTIYVPAGQGKAPMVDVRDIAAVAAACLTEPGHENQVYEVTGPEPIGYSDIAAVFTQVLGRQVGYVDIPVEAAAKAMIDSGMPPWLAHAINELNTEMKLGHFSTVSDVVERVGKKKPVTIEQFVREHAAVFQ